VSSRSFLDRLAEDLAAAAGAARDAILGRSPGEERFVIALYGGFGNAERAMIHGRVLRENRIAPAAITHSRWQNVLSMIRRIHADPLRHATVRVSLGSVSTDITTDDEGFFHAVVPTSGDAVQRDDDWLRVDAKLVGAPASEVATLPNVDAHGRVLVPARPPRFLVISDVDDTVLHSNATSLITALRIMLFENARTRLPFPGVAAFYQALRAGRSGTDGNPVFYVSSSPWNLHDVITEFLDAQGIPPGPIMLRDVDLGFDALSSRHHHTHKREMVRRVLATYPGAPVILIGDSGQEDPEIYRDVVHEFPNRIVAVYIRNVTANPERSASIRRLAEEVLKAGSSLVLADDTLAAARHAAEHGWIAADSVGAVGEEKRKDEGTTPGKADAPGARDAGEGPPPTIIEAPPQE
jgi:phosphatidate phosphatase APP1